MQILATSLFAMYIVFTCVILYNGCVGMKEKKNWYLVNKSVFQMMFITMVILTALFIGQTYHADHLQERLEFYERQTRK